MLLDSYRYAALASAWGAADGAQHQASQRREGSCRGTASLPLSPRPLLQGLAASAALSSAAASRAGAVGLEGAAGSAVPKLPPGTGPRPDWRCNVGEGLVRVEPRRWRSRRQRCPPPLAPPPPRCQVSLLVGRVSRGVAGGGSAGADVVALGERTLLCVKDSNPSLAPPAAPSPGAVAGGASGSAGAAQAPPPTLGGPSPFRLQKRLGYAPACACVYARAPVASASLPGSSHATGGPAAVGAGSGAVTARGSSGAQGGAAQPAAAEDPSVAGLLVASHDARLFVYLAETLQARPHS